MSIAQYLLDKWNGLTPATDKAQYLDKLHSGGVWTVEFDKVDGTPAIMDVTLDPSIVPPTPVVAGAPAKPLREEKDHLIHAYSPDRAGWRSFTVANVKAFYPKR